VKYENITMNIERRSSAIMIIDYLLDILPSKKIDPFKRLFNWIMNEPLAHPGLYEEACLPMSRRSSDIYVRAKRFFGFATSGSGQTSRTELYSTTIQQAAAQCKDRIYDNALATQLLSLVTRDGRVDHPKGGHDDLVIAWLLTMWMLTKGKNLSSYGIDNRKVLSFQEQDKTKSKDEMIEDHKQKLIRNKIDLLYDLISREQDDILIERYEQQLRSLEKELILKEGEVFTLDAFLDEIKINRRKQVRDIKPLVDKNIDNHQKLQRMGRSMNGDVVFM
jgi:hypothetical protein